MAKTKTALTTDSKQSKKDKRTSKTSDDEESEAEEEWEVEKVVGKRTEKGHTLYEIKWKGYSEDDNTWEPPSNLKGIKNLIKAYEKEHAEESEESEEEKVPKIDKKSKKIQKSEKESKSDKHTKKGKEDSKTEKSDKKKTEDGEKKQRGRPKKGLDEEKSEESKEDSRKNSTSRIEKESPISPSDKSDKKEKKKDKAHKESKSSSTAVPNALTDSGLTDKDYGNFQNDTASHIDDHAQLDEKDQARDVTSKTSLDKVLFQVQWKKRSNGVQPGPGYYSYTILKKKCPELLLDYIAKMVNFD